MIRQVMVLSLAILTWTEAVAQSPTPIPSSSTTPALSSLPGYSSTAVADGYLAARKPLRDALGMETEGTEGERSDEIETDRDSFTPATATVGRETLVLEAAYSFLDNRIVKNGHSFPEFLVRYGLTERLELRLGWNYEIDGVPVEHEPGQSVLESESKLTYGFKYRVTDGKEWVPGSALIVAGFSPTSGVSHQTNLVVTYVFGWELPNEWKLDAAFRYGTGTEERDHFNEWAPSVVLKIPIGERVNIHAEYFGIFSTGKAEQFSQNYFSPGVHFLLTDDLEVGTRVAWGLNDQSTRFIMNAGIGWRF